MTPMPIDSFSLPTQRGDLYVLCTDGAEKEMERADLPEVLGDYSPRLLASRLVTAARRRVPQDDATVVVVRIREDAEFAWERAYQPPSWSGRAGRLSPRSEGRRSKRPYEFDRPFARTIRSKRDTTGIF